MDEFPGMLVLPLWVPHFENQGVLSSTVSGNIVQAMGLTHGLGGTLKNINETGNLKFSDIFSGCNTLKILSINVETQMEFFPFFRTHSFKT